ncbi:hypothetical protein BDL97_13G114400 [Sphagnum fallax]|nr:hypothetical protein BDL97_13G114400 [Sphagnum fallax]
MTIMGKFSFVFVLGFVLMISMQNIAVVVAQSCPAAERDALLAFKAGITEDPSGQLTTWVATTDCCTWFGIFCENGHVIELGLRPDDASDNSGIYLTGPLGSSLFTLLELEVLDLSEMQNLTGPISPAIGNLTNLVHLDFRTNKLTGPIPSSVGNLKKLNWLSLGGNPISGSIPSSIGTIGASLNYIYLGESSLSGILPNSLFQLSNLTSLFLGVSDLSGSLSPLVGNLGPTLTVLDLSSNSFTGALPSTLGELTKVFLLDLSFNQFTGQIPASIGNIGATLFNLELANNELTGPIPPMFAKQLTGLAALGLENNKLTGPIPQGAPFSNFSVDSFTPGNPGLCGHPLPPCKGGNRKKLL